MASLKSYGDKILTKGRLWPLTSVNYSKLPPSVSLELIKFIKFGEDDQDSM